MEPLWPFSPDVPNQLTMLSKEQLRVNAQEKIASAKALLTAHRPGDAAYLVGYALEFQLKARIVEHQRMPGWPDNRSEFRSMKTIGDLKTHDLNKLLALSGRSATIKAQCMVEWSNSLMWTPESRYAPVGSVTALVAEHLIKDVEVLLTHL